MTGVPLFSVIVPTHNRQEFLTDAINSVLAQTEKDFEVVVVDDPPARNHPSSQTIRGSGLFGVT